MKKNLIFAALIAAATIFSCAKEPVTNDNTDPTEPTEEAAEEGVYVYTLSASMETLSDETAPQNPEEQNNEEQNQEEQNPEDGEVKATISDAGAFAWEAGDAIAVFATNGQKYTFTASAAGASVTFTTTATVSGLDFSGCKAYYPASIAGASAGSVTLPSSYASVDAARKAFPMEGTVSADGTISFKHLGGLLKVTINNAPSFAKRFELSSNKSLTGSFSVVSEKIAAASTAGSVTVNFTHSSNENMSFYIPVPTGSHTFSMNLYDATTGGNTIIGVTGSKSSTISRANMSVKKPLTVGPVVDIKNFATSWTAAYIYLFSGEDYFDTPWGNLSQVMKSYNDGTYDHYYRVLPSSALNNTYEVIVFNSANDTYRIRTSILIENQTNYSASQKEGLRKVGDSHHRVIVWDQALGTNTSDNPNTFFYIKSIDGGHEAATGSWESEGTKALGWFIGKRNNNASGRYYYFDTNAISSYSGKSLTFEYTMKNGNDQWRGSYNNSGYSYKNYLHLGCYFDSNTLKWFVDTGFDNDMSE